MSKIIAFAWPHEAASEVRLAGSFNSWQPQDMKYDPADGSWKIEREVKPGNHQFKFVVDGLWVHDEGQPHLANEVGSENNVIEVLAPTPAKGALTIEVERKFEVPKDFKKILPAHGYKAVADFAETLVDEYFDTKNYDLLKSDHWLRQRNGDWEMKYPLGAVHEGDVTLYHETSNVDDILSRLRNLTEDERDKSNLNELESRGILTSYARLETTRHCYKKDEVNIVVDDTDWDYRVGEIEIVVSEKKNVSAATSKIDAIAKELDLLSNVPKGKLVAYLKMKKSPAYDALMECLAAKQTR